MEQKSFYAIIVAGGSGQRMNTEVPKQFLELNGTPILMHSIHAFFNNEYQPNIILVLSQNDVAFWEQLIKKYNFSVPHKVVVGGKERFFSVQNGLNLITDENAVIAIHDAVRPLVSQKTISNCYKSAITNGNAVAAIPSKDSVRRIQNGKSEALNRKEIHLVQTPQTFTSYQLKTAYQQDFDDFFTDDASVVEKAGFAINLELGDEFNFKITFKEDLALASALIKNGINT